MRPGPSTNLTLQIAALVCASAACDTSGVGSAPTAVRDTVDGVERITYSSEDLRPLAWRFDTLRVLGGARMDDPRYQFQAVRAAGLDGDPAGDLYVLDASGHRVVRYDSEGTFVRGYGRQGEGPGELRTPWALDVARDTVWVLGTGTRRLTGYPLEQGNAVVRSIRMEDGMPSGHLVVLEDGFLVVRQVFPPDPAREAREGVRIARLTADGAVAGTVWQVPVPEKHPVRFARGDVWATTFVAPEYWPELRWSALSDGTVVVADGPAYALVLVSPEGRPVLRIERDEPPRPVTEDDRERARKRIRERWEGSGQSAAVIRERLEAATFADHVPRIVRLGVDGRDRIWVGVSTEDPNVVGRVDVYSREGEPLGSLEGFEPPDTFLGGDRAAALLEDPATGVQRIALLRLADGPDLTRTGSRQRP